VNYFIGLALQGKDLPVFGDGAQLRTLTYVDDCVDALILAASNPKADGKALFAVGDQQYTVRQLAEGIVKGMRGGSVRYVEWPKDREAIEVGDAVISNARIRETLGWSARVPLSEGLDRTRTFFASSLKHYLR
jgi:UDP-glucose 4-epimerase